MAYKQQSHYIKLWDREDTFSRKDNSRARRGERRNWRGESPYCNSRGNGGSVLLNTAPGTMAAPKYGQTRSKHRKTSPENLLQSAPPAGRKISSAGVSRGRATSSSILPERAQSSLGFRENLLPRPQGFDLQEYVRRHGPTNEIRIGVNGAATSDDYFDRYLEECASVVEQDRDMYSSCSDYDVDVEELPSSGSEQSCDEVMVTSLTRPSKSRSSTVSNEGFVPLCWEDQLKHAEVRISAKIRN